MAFNIKFYCRVAKSDKTGLSPIELSININGQRTFIALPRKENPVTFKQSITSKKDNDIKTYCEAVRTRLGVIQSEMMITGKALTAQAVKEYFKTGGIQSRTFEDLWNEFIGIIYKRDVTKFTKRKYEIVRDLSIKAIGNKQVTDLIQSDILKVTNMLKDYDSTTRAGMMTKLKAVIRYALDNNYLKVNPFCNIKIEKKQKDANFLTKEEVERLRALDLSYNPSLEVVRDTYLLGIGTGLAYCDLSTLRIEDIKQDDDMYYIEGRRAKTGQKYTSVLLPYAVEILNKYNGIPRVISNQKTNAYLKVVADLAGISKRITYHSARHTYITLCITKDIPIAVVAQMAGHSNTRMTSHYCHLLSKDILNTVRKAF